MKAVILNSGMGRRMGEYTENQPKCMVPLLDETIIEMQLKQLYRAGIREAVITTGPFSDRLEQHVKSLGLPMSFSFIHNPEYEDTNYIYSLFLAEKLLHDDILLLHGDLVFDGSIPNGMITFEKSCMAVSTVCELPDKDFKAVRKDGRIIKVGTEFFENAVSAQPLYKFFREDWEKWLEGIGRFVRSGMVSCYAENALNEIGEEVELYPYDYGYALCQEVDDKEDLASVREKLKKR
ncbi:phosphocholine cytidylyltransferase family protein [Hungatella hathewayi]|uniref:phosphocholine cytidylyltransferase family protein n=1 Tax=Hungatella hathewayi TaxID=154046 RepID=UPI003563F1D1